MYMKNKNKNKIIIFFAAVILSAAFLIPQSSSAETILTSRALSLDSATVQKGYTFQLDDASFRLGILPGSLSSGTQIDLKVLSEHNLPTNKRLVSRIYEFDIKSPEVYVSGKPLVVDIKLDVITNNLKQIHFWDGNQKTWRPVRTWNNLSGRSRAFLFLPYAKLAVFSENTILENGKASWYSYKGCNCAASPDFPKDSLLKVTNTANDKSVVIKVNDFGPDRNVHPDRVIDLDLVAYNKIGLKSEGLINVRIEPLDYFVPVSFETPEDFSLIDVKATAAIVIDGISGDVLWAKNEEKVLPIASLTKLMTAYVFLETNTPMDKVVTYSKVDDAEGAKLYVQPGDQLTTKDLFYTTLIGSANNAAKCLARSTGLTSEEFVRRMNAQAKEWGLSDTIFYEPTGLDPNNVSSVSDLAILSKNVLSRIEMLWATAAKGYSLTTVNTEKKHKFKNTNRLTYQSELAVTGGKTGYLDEAGYCLMTRAKDNNGRRVIAIVLNNPDSQARFAETEALINWGFENNKQKLIAMR